MESFSDLNKNPQIKTKHTFVKGPDGFVFDIETPLLQTSPAEQPTQPEPVRALPTPEVIDLPNEGFSRREKIMAVAAGLATAVALNKGLDVSNGSQGDNGTILSDAVAIPGMAFLGIGNRRQRSKEHSINAAKAVQEKSLPGEPYNPLAGWQSGHRTRKLENESLLPEKPVDHNDGASSILQKRSAMRANLRHDALLKRRNIIHEATDLYGDELYDAKETKKMLKNEPNTRKEKKSIRKASKVVRSNDASAVRIQRRLDRQQRGGGPGFTGFR